MTTQPVTKPATLPVLLIEDEPAVMDFVRATLERNGYSVVCSESGANGLRLLESGEFMGVVSDMLEVRHTLNNALTSVMGNSELLLLEPHSLSAASRSQIETIRNMGVRMHEILQRFSSIEKELNAVEQQAENEARTRVRTAAASS